MEGENLEATKAGAWLSLANRLGTTLLLLCSYVVLSLPSDPQSAAPTMYAWVPGGVGGWGNRKVQKLALGDNAGD